MYLSSGNSTSITSITPGSSNLSNRTPISNVSNRAANIPSSLTEAKQVAHKVLLSAQNQN